MARLSVVLIVRNEEDQIAQCLDRVKWADEVIVMDDASTDKTAEIARRYTDKVFIRRTNNNFTEQRNIGGEKASADWILQLDADELITEENIREIRQLINNPGNYVAFQFKRRNHFLGHFMRYGGYYHYYIRLYKKGRARYKGMIHERLTIDGPLGTARNDINHYPFKSISQYLTRQNHYTSQDALDLFNKKGVVSKKEIRYHLTVKPLKLIWKLFIKKKGYREKFYGLVFAVLDAFTHFISWAKYWEIVREKIDGKSGIS